MKATRPSRYRHRCRGLKAALLMACTSLALATPSPGLHENTELSAGGIPAPMNSSMAVNRNIGYVPPPSQTRPVASNFDVEYFETLAQALVANQRVPGLAMAIVQNGRVLSARGYGVTDVRDGQPVDAHTVFRLASLSKPFAGTLAGMLVAEGALRWDSRITDYMPSLQLSAPGAAQRLTVADVLSHRVGINRNAFDRDIERNASYASLVQRLSSLPMNCMPGECYAYQNVAFSLIGDVVFATTGQFYGDSVARRILMPLGMNDASVGLEGLTSSPRWARPHVRARGGWAPVSPKPTYYRVGPAAGVNASASDMAQWLLAQTGYRTDVLSESLLSTLQTPVVDTPGEVRGQSWRGQRLSQAGYGMGWRIYDYAGHRMVFHGGAVQGYRGVIAMIPERDVGVAILWNGESNAPSGLLPTILDSAIGLPYHAWLDVGEIPEAMYARQRQQDAAGAQSQRANASPY